MSRCFPYPPPGYLNNGVRGEAVRDPTKLKRGKEKPITELDSKKRNDKKPRKVKKDKKNGKGNKELGYMVDTYDHSGKSSHPKGKEEEAERSDLTEEHEQPVFSLNVCHSPDSGGRGNKRKLDHSASITKAHGNILRIRLPLQRHREPDATLRADGLCSDSGNVESLAQQAETSTVRCREDCYPVTCNSEVGSKSVISACVADFKVKDNNNAKIDSVSSHKKKHHKMASLYKTLIEDWIPQSLDYDQDIFDDSWLLPSKEQVGCKRLKSSHSDQPCHESSNLWPRARYLSEADVYALPYSIPF